ncbi:30S ribosomal protein s6 chloroplastic-like [Trifolium pratense]|uniref:30S ribosomal protein s6 chloroplastic-like n=1 Tax=Trifolium pratense TaxID=57577 RepID=A0A2K3N5C6_TRIPR|nr:30S ribosomal protein s6 chloroplastic-like [Trifolium pratense]
MAFSSLTSIPLSSSSSLYAPSISSALRAFPQSNFHLKRNNNYSNLSLKAQTLNFTGSFFEGGLGSDDDDDDDDDDDVVIPGFADLEEREEPECPPGLRPYETMVVLRPDMSEDERLAFTQKYEELLVAGGGMYVEVFNRGVIPLAYSIQKKNKEGETNTYMDGIYLLFTYFTKPESIAALEDTLLRDDNVIRSTSFKIRKRRD